MDCSKLSPKKSERQLLEEKLLKDLESADWEVIDYGWRTSCKGRFVKVKQAVYGNYYLDVDNWDRFRVPKKLLDVIKAQQFEKFKEWVG